VPIDENPKASEKAIADLAMRSAYPRRNDAGDLAKLDSIGDSLQSLDTEYRQQRKVLEDQATKISSRRGVNNFPLPSGK
jgi:hypothetical protein